MLNICLLVQLWKILTVLILFKSMNWKTVTQLQTVRPNLLWFIIAFLTHTAWYSKEQGIQAGCWNWTVSSGLTQNATSEQGLNYDLEISFARYSCFSIPPDPVSNPQGEGEKNQPSDNVELTLYSLPVLLIEGKERNVLSEPQTEQLYNKRGSNVIIWFTVLSLEKKQWFHKLGNLTFRESSGRNNNFLKNVLKFEFKIMWYHCDKN